jgi:membrane protease YdiL (CAAX protease family)
MTRARILKVVLGIALSAGVALLALYTGQLVKLPEGSFVPGSFVTHSVMLGASLALILIFSRGRLAAFGFTWGSYRFRPIILVWALPTAALSLLSMLSPEPARGPGVLAGQSQLQLVLFVWIYASVCEEVLTRGLLQTLISGPAASGGPARFTMPVVVSGLFFGAMHLVLLRSMGPPAVVLIVLATLLGFLAARYREVTGSLIPAIIVHALFNVGGMLPGWIIGWVSP